ncbi:MAG: CBS domain-containing protein, partial [Anaerolineae bacterium]
MAPCLTPAEPIWRRLMLVKERMTANPITATVNTTHSEAVALLRPHRIRRLPVLD